MRTGAIVPVKTFSRAKKRLDISSEKKERLCRIMLESVLETISKSQSVERIAIVSRDEDAFAIGKRYGVAEIYDGQELGVNSAVRLADDYFLKEGFESTVVFPQDVPLIQTEDVNALLDFRTDGPDVLVVPSRKFDGTNALVRTPPGVMETHYDEDSYRIHLSTAERRGSRSALVLIQRMMMDMDDRSDLDLIMRYDLPASRSIAHVLL
ncbi:MAG: 2-phospho-L-lactate guanylyltransferase [Thaumarchaeota archaeon]|nr:2-phospho-L-lactate guanylyltransferase [Nitrososphaerota archaeon]